LLPQNFQDYGKNTGFPTDDTEEDNALSYPTATVPQMVEGNGEASFLGLLFILFTLIYVQMVSFHIQGKPKTAMVKTSVMVSKC
jgi:hypothetical protein